MSQSYGEGKSLEERLAILENVIARQDQKIQVLATLFSISNVSPFDGPWKQFVDAADEYFDFFYETNVPCHNDCSERYNKSDKGERAKVNLAECRAACASLIDSHLITPPG